MLITCTGVPYRAGSQIVANTEFSHGLLRNICTFWFNEYKNHACYMTPHTSCAHCVCKYSLDIVRCWLTYFKTSNNWSTIIPQPLYHFNTVMSKVLQHWFICQWRLPPASDERVVLCNMQNEKNISSRGWLYCHWWSFNLSNCQPWKPELMIRSWIWPFCFIYQTIVNKG